MNRQEFEKLAVEAIGELPKHIQQKMENVAVVVEDSPSADQLKMGGATARNILLGLYEGVPRSKRGPGYTMVLPDKITIFQKSIERVAHTPENIKRQVRSTVRHEIAHHFGFDEAGARDLDNKRHERD